MRKSTLLRMLFFIAAVIFWSTPFVSAEISQPDNTITLTTYYPAPFGAYKKMTISDSVGIGTTAPNARLYIKGSGNNDQSFGLGIRNSDDTYSL
ncbi:MAG TPA: hypothetical protein VJA17_04085, partial [Candidatus Omnitrophota bacterium]|nr:hypothetical protein [Candidatus Omnitrophota bacterium]